MSLQESPHFGDHALTTFRMTASGDWRTNGFSETEKDQGQGGLSLPPPLHHKVVRTGQIGSDSLKSSLCKSFVDETNRNQEQNRVEADLGYEAPVSLQESPHRDAHVHDGHEQAAIPGLLDNKARQ